MRIMRRFVLLALSGLFLGLHGGTVRAADAPRRVALGIAVTPKHFPAHTATDLDEAFRMARDLGKYAINVSVVAWALLHDVGLTAFDENLNTVGLATQAGQRKKGYPAFEEWSRSLR